MTHSVGSFAKAMRRLVLALPTTGLLLGASTSTAQSGAILFDFKASSALSNNTGAPTPGNDNSPTIQNYMNGVLHDTSNNGNPSWNVGVQGAESSGAVSAINATTTQRKTNAGWNADDHVVNNSGTSIPDTLATKYNVPFIETSGSLIINGDKAIKLIFSGGITINSLSFNFEIFPDGTGEQPPDFTFLMTSSAGTAANCTAYGLTPNFSQSQTSGSCGSNGTYFGNFSDLTSNLHSGFSGISSNETSKQYLGTMTFDLTNNPITNPTLTFIDWPDTIGVTNIQFGLPSGGGGHQEVPEPGSLILLGSALAGLGVLGRRRRKV